MKDLDFDELDKAVNSLIASTPGGSGSDNSASASQPPVQPLPANPTPMQNSANSLPTIPISNPVNPVDRPSTGRFMDVVHPSSDMRTSLVMPERNSSKMMPNPISQPPMPAVINESSLNNPVEPVMANQPNDLTNPDISTDKDEDDDINQIGNDIAKSLGQTTNDEAPESPFLSGAKVEKRPLGAFSDELATITPNQPMVPEVAQPPMVQSDSNSSLNESNTSMPAELQSDLLALESDSTTTPEKTVPVTPLPTPTTSSAMAQPAVSTSPAIPVSTSIPQQYKEQPNTGDQNNGAIYDTKAYHKPMVKPTKKKSGWMWVIWAIVLLIAGSGAGAAVYFFVLPRL